MKVDCHLGIVNKVERRLLDYFGAQAERQGVRSALAISRRVMYPTTINQSRRLFYLTAGPAFPENTGH
jgi:hypothetical protein